MASTLTEHEISELWDHAAGATPASLARRFDEHLPTVPELRVCHETIYRTWTGSSMRGTEMTWQPRVADIHRSIQEVGLYFGTGR